MNPEPRFTWRLLLILLPATALTAYGIYVLKQERSEIRQTAREEAAEALTEFTKNKTQSSDYAKVVNSFFYNQDRYQDASEGQDEPQGLYEIHLAADGSLQRPPEPAPPLPPETYSVNRLTPNQRVLWQSVLNPTDQDSTHRLQILHEFWNSDPPPYFRASTFIRIQQIRLQTPVALEEARGLEWLADFPLAHFDHLKLHEGDDPMKRHQEDDRREMPEVGFRCHLLDFPMEDGLTAGGHLLLNLMQSQSGLATWMDEFSLVFHCLGQSSFHSSNLSRRSEPLIKIKERLENESINPSSTDPAAIDAHQHQANEDRSSSVRKRRNVIAQIEGQVLWAQHHERNQRFQHQVLNNPARLAELRNLPLNDTMMVTYSDRLWQIWKSQSGPRFAAAPLGWIQDLTPRLAEWTKRLTPPGPFKIRFEWLQGDSRRRVRIAALADSGTIHHFGIPPHRFRVFLEDPESYYATHRRKTWQMAGMLVMGWVCVAAGSWASWSGFRKQRKLTEAKSNFVAAVSHELRTPIASIRLIAQELRDADDGSNPLAKDRVRNYHQLIGRESQRLDRLIENVLETSRIDRGMLSYSLEPTDLEALAKNAVELVQPLCRDRGIELRLVIETSQPSTTDAPLQLPVEAEADGPALTRALLNLIDNAIKYSPPAGIVTVRLARNDEGVAINVEDEGPGIPPSDRQAVFEPFTRRGSELTRDSQGVGLGLSIVRHTAQAHGGDVTIHDRPGGGCHVRLELPLPVAA